MEYESNPKHAHAWQRGRRGSLCPREVRAKASELLAGSELVGSRRYAVYRTQAYCAAEHRPGVWHGYPVAWQNVPKSVRDLWRKEGRVRRRDMQKSRT